MKKFNQAGLGLIEGLLALVLVIGLLVVVFAVHKTNEDNKKADTSAKTSTGKVLNIKEWKINIPYTGSDTLSYRMSSKNTVAVIISANLAKQFDCTKSGAGQIARFYPNDLAIGQPAGGTKTVAEAAKGSGNYGHVGDYYYEFFQDPVACSAKMAKTSRIKQTAANFFTQAQLSKIQLAN